MIQKIIFENEQYCIMIPAAKIYLLRVISDTAVQFKDVIANEPNQV